MYPSYRVFLESKAHPSQGRLYHVEGRFPFTGGQARDGSILCRHGWDAVPRRDDTVYGCPGHIAPYLLKKKRDDGLACGYFAFADRVTPLYINSRWDEQTYWGAYPPTLQELDERREYLTTTGDHSTDPSPAIIRRLRSRGIPSSSLPRSLQSPTRQRILEIIRSSPPEFDQSP